MNYHALRYLFKKKEARNLPHSKGKNLEYTELLMAEYLSSSDLDISIDGKKWIFKIRTEDIYLPTNRRWMKEDLNCYNCINLEMNQSHLLNSKYLLGTCEIVTYVPDYNDIYNGTIEEMLYTCRILKENYKLYTSQKEDHVN